MRMKVILMIAAAAFVAVGCGAGKMKEDGNKFMELLKVSDAEKSYAMLDSELQKKVGELEGWKKFIEPRKVTTWNFSGFEVRAGGSGTLTGDAEFANGQKLPVTLQLVKAGDDWKVVGLLFGTDK